MALKGTLRDFGIADIFQLIGHQGKTGILLLKNREVEVRIFFSDGNVTAADHSHRGKKELLGDMMVRAGVINESQLESSLDMQTRTLRRLGDVIVDAGYTDRETVQDFARLQTTETIYRLFTWKAGSYEFSQEQIDVDPNSFSPIRSESVLMEGFRIVDEWPAVRKTIPHLGLTFTYLKPLPEEAVSAGGDGEDDFLAGIDDAFAGFGEDDDDDDDAPGEIGYNERMVYGLASEDRTVQEIIDRSLLGEFETCKALKNLVDGGYLQVHQSDQPAGLTGESIKAGFTDAVVPGLTRLLLLVLVAGSVGAIFKLATLDQEGLLSAERALTVRSTQLTHQAGEMQLARIRQALEIFRLREGRYPADLNDLVLEGVLREYELSFPYRTPYSYALNEDGTFLLALPLR
jgi:hypothetical protein